MFGSRPPIHDNLSSVGSITGCVQRALRLHVIQVDATMGIGMVDLSP